MNRLTVLIEVGGVEFSGPGPHHDVCTVGDASVNHGDSEAASLGHSLNRKDPESIVYAVNEWRIVLYPLQDTLQVPKRRAARRLRPLGLPGWKVRSRRTIMSGRCSCGREKAH